MSLLTPFLIGIFSSVHCMAMCGGLCGLFVKSNTHIKSIIIINLGRVFTYSILGLIVSGVVQGFVLQIPLASIGFWVRSVLGFVIIYLGLRIIFNKTSLHAPYSNNLIWQKAKIKLHSLNNNNSQIAQFSKGMLWGLIPCGLLYGVLIGAATTQNLVSGSLFMLAFGLGTMPSMLVTTGIMKNFKNKLQSKSIRFGAGVFIIVIGFWSIISPWFSHELIPNNPVYTSIVAFLDSCIP